MTLEEILDLIQATRPNQLTSVQKLVMRCTWEGKTYQDMAQESHYDAKYLKNAGSQLWELLSDLFGEPINKMNCLFTLKQRFLTKEQRRLIEEVNPSQTSDLENPESLEFPSRPVPLNSTFYIERSPIEERTRQEVLKPGALVRIKAPRQMGKTSLMLRILAAAREQGYRTVALSFEQADRKGFTDLDQFLRWFCANLTRKLQLPYQVDDYWSDSYGSKGNCTAYFEDCLLSATDTPLVLALDQVDAVFPHPEIADDFFTLLRSWYEEAAYGDSGSQLWENLRLIIVHSTEVYIPLDINKSPFNVGLAVELQPFTPEQVDILAQHHGLNLSGENCDRLMKLVAGHPYLVRVALYHLARQDVSIEQLMQKAATDGAIYSHHLHRHLWNLQQHPPLSAAFEQVVKASAPVELDQMRAFKLHSMGLVNLQGNKVTPSCELYRQYFGTNPVSRSYQLPESIQN